MISILANEQRFVVVVSRVCVCVFLVSVGTSHQVAQYIPTATHARKWYSVYLPYLSIHSWTQQTPLTVSFSFIYLLSRRDRETNDLYAQTMKWFGCSYLQRAHRGHIRATMNVLTTLKRTHQCSQSERASISADREKIVQAPPRTNGSMVCVSNRFAQPIHTERDRESCVRHTSLFSLTTEADSRRRASTYTENGCS